MVGELSFEILLNFIWHKNEAFVVVMNKIDADNKSEDYCVIKVSKSKR